MNRFTIWMFSLVTFLTGDLMWAQPYTLRSLQVEDGLSQNMVYCVIQDRDDYIWIGTQDGLNRYDGNSFKVYKKTDGSGLFNDGVCSLNEDHDGNIWVGTIAGLHIFNPSNETFRFVPLRDISGNPIDGLVRDIEFGPEGEAYVAIADTCLIRIGRDFTSRQISLGEKGRGINIRDLQTDSAGNLWIASYAGGLLELLVLVLLAHEALDHPDAAQVLLHHVVQLVIGFEHALEDRMRAGHDQIDTHAEDRQGDQEYHGNPGVDRHRHNQREQQRQRRAHRHPQDHLEAVLNVRHVRGEPGDDGSGAEFINVGKGKILNAVIHVVPQIPGKTGGGHRRHPSGKHARNQGNHGSRQQQTAVEKDLLHTAGMLVRTDAPVDQPGHDHRNQGFHRHFPDHKQRGGNGLLFILPHSGGQFFDHPFPILSLH